MRFRSAHLITGAALLALVPQWIQYANHVRRGDYPGSSYAPRVDAVLKASEPALEGGPLATILAPGGYSVAPGLLNDLGVAVIVDLYSRATGRPATVRTLGLVNLVVLVVAGAGVVFAFPPAARLALVPVFLWLPMAVPLYRSADSIAIHGALAAVAAAAVAATLRPGPLVASLGTGVALFLVHKLRSPLALYAFPPLLLGAAWWWWRWRDRSPATRAACLLLAFTACEIPWQVAVHRRATHPRLVEKDSLPTHAAWEPLVSGIGWTENPWGIQPWDPWVAVYLAERTGAELVGIATEEGERRSRRVYFELLWERPGALAVLYLKRIPYALGRYTVFGSWMSAVWILLAVAGLVTASSRRDLPGFAALTGALGVVAGLVGQVVLIDTRYIYAYPLELVSALALAAGIGVLVATRLQGRPLPATAQPTQSTHPAAGEGVRDPGRAAPAAS